MNKRQYSLFFILLIMVNCVMAMGARTALAAETSDLKYAGLTFKPAHTYQNGAVRWFDANGQCGKFQVDVGEPVLSRLDNSQITVESDEEMIFYTEFCYQVPVNYWTYYSYQDMIQSYENREVIWCTIKPYKIDIWNTYHWEPQIPSKADWDYLVMKPGDQGSFKDVHFKVTFNTIPAVFRQSTTYNSTLNSSIKEFYIMSFKTLERNSSKLGVYKTEFSGNWQGGSFQYSDVNSYKTAMTGQMSSYEKFEIESYFNSYAVGINAEKPTWSTKQQGSTKGSSLEVPLHFSSNGNNHPAWLKVPIEMKPEVQTAMQPIRVGSAIFDHRLKHDYYGEMITKKTYLGEKQYDDIRAVKVQNYVIQELYEVKISAISSLKLTGDIKSADLLKVPHLELSDMYWRMSINGDVNQFLQTVQTYTPTDAINDMYQTSNSFLPLFKEYLIYIIIAIVAIAALVFIVKMPARRG